MNEPTRGRRCAAHCRLATERPEYADGHKNCHGPFEVRLTPIPPGTLGELITTLHCDCPCHDRSHTDTPKPPAEKGAVKGDA